MDLEKYLEEKRTAVNSALDSLLPVEKEFPQTLHSAMRYSMFAGGKRIRPAMTIAAAEAVGGNAEDVIEVACATELIHTYSLIHDDLPAMDDDDLRRGKPTCHKAFGEAQAILAGDALLTLAFEVMVEGAKGANNGMIIQVIGEMAKASGSLGMVGGQLVDIESEGMDVDIAILDFIHTHKTGALINASIRIGAIMAGGTAGQLDAITKYGKSIGTAFQITDDILDVVGEKEQLGKNTNGDAKKGKVTYPGLVGLSESKRRAKEWMDIALDALKDFDKKADPLRAIACYIVERRW